jgi:hypothetical protein
MALAQVYYRKQTKAIAPRGNHCLVCRHRGSIASLRNGQALSETARPYQKRPKRPGLIRNSRNGQALSKTARPDPKRPKRPGLIQNGQA